MKMVRILVVVGKWPTKISNATCKKCMLCNKKYLSRHSGVLLMCILYLIVYNFVRFRCAENSFVVLFRYKTTSKLNRRLSFEVISKENLEFFSKCWCLHTDSKHFKCLIQKYIWLKQDNLWNFYRLLGLLHLESCIVYLDVLLLGPQTNTMSMACFCSFFRVSKQGPSWRTWGVCQLELIWGAKKKQWHSAEKVCMCETL